MDDAARRAPVTYEDIEGAAERLEGVAHRTPVATSRLFDELTGAGLSSSARTCSAWAPSSSAAPTTRFPVSMPMRAAALVAFPPATGAKPSLAGRSSALRADRDAGRCARREGRGPRAYSAGVFYDRAAGQNREDVAERIAKEKGSTVIPPFDHAHVIAGQGTAAKELIEDVGALDDLFVPTGGAGLLSGSAIAAARLSPGIRVIGVEPAGGDDAARSFRTKTLQRVENPQTIADGARTQSLGKLTFPLVMANVHDVVTVTDAQIVEAMRFLWERMKLVVEPTGALAAAAVLCAAAPVRERRVGIIISGGNVDLKAAAALFA